MMDRRARNYIRSWGYSYTQDAVVPEYSRHYELSSGPDSRLPRALCQQPAPDSSRFLEIIALASRLQR